MLGASAASSLPALEIMRTLFSTFTCLPPAVVHELPVVSVVRVRGRVTTRKEASSVFHAIRLESCKEAVCETGGTHVRTTWVLDIAEANTLRVRV